MLLFPFLTPDLFSKYSVVALFFCSLVACGHRTYNNPRQSTALLSLDRTYMCQYTSIGLAVICGSPLLMSPPLIGGDIKRCFCLTSVRLSVINKMFTAERATTICSPLCADACQEVVVYEFQRLHFTQCDARFLRINSRKFTFFSLGFKVTEETPL